MANDAKKVSELAVTTTLSANDRVVILSNPSSAANTKTITAANFANSLVSSGIIPTATTTQLGVVKVDGTTITISNGVISGASNTGNIRFTNNVITSVVTGDITISPNTSGALVVPSIKIPVGSVIQNTISISTVVNNAILLTINSYSTNSSAIPAGTLGNANTIPAPWTVYQLTATPTPILQINDIVGGAGIPANSAIQYVGSSPYGAYFVTNATFSSSPAANGIALTFARPVINPSFQISTANSTDIALITGANGHVAVNSDIIPVTTNEFRLGTPANRFKELWLGSGTLYVLDETLGVDQAIGANAGNFYIKGGAGLSVGEFIFRDNTIQISNTARDIYIGANLATGNVIFNRPIAVKSYDTGNVTFAVARNGRVQTFSPSIPSNDIGAFSVIGSADGSYKPVRNPGGMLHITGNANTTTRVTLDNFGSGNTTVQLIGRSGRGTANAATASQANDVLFRIAGAGYINDNTQFATLGVLVPTTIEFVALDNFTDGTQGSTTKFYNAPSGNSVKTLSMSVTANGITLPSNAGIRFSDNTYQNTAYVATTTGSFNPNFTTNTGNVLVGMTQTGNYTKTGNLCYFRVYVNYANVSSFADGSGQYQITLPFPSVSTISIRGGSLHNVNTASIYHIGGIVEIASNASVLGLYYSGSTTDLAWKNTTPVGWATGNSTHFDISGIYETT
jgi:hypothetical protein